VWSLKRFPTPVHPDFLDQSFYFLSSSSFILTRLIGPRSRHSENLLASGIELDTSGTVARQCEHYTREAVRWDRVIGKGAVQIFACKYFVLNLKLFCLEELL
jgi:hypothetical protein